MSTFGGLSIAASGLNAARAALEVTGQNVANANTAGYTRQRVDQVTLAPTTPAIFSTASSFGDGVSVTGVSRVNDSVVDARVRSTAGASAYWSTTSDAVSSVETALNEPSTSGLSQVMTDFFNAWGAMANASTTGTAAASAGSTLIAKGQLVAASVASGYQAASDGWTGARSATASAVTTINDTAAKVADLNKTIRQLTAGGGTANSLLDARDAAVTTLSALTGATTRSNKDGTIDVIVGGNALVSGPTSRTVALSGTTDFSAAGSAPVKLTWADTGSAVSLDGGSIAARIATLAGANSGGTGGVYAEAAQTYNTLATNIADAVNYLHKQGTTSAGTTGVSFFSYSTTSPAATTLAVIPTDVTGIAAADATKGNSDTTIADRISLIGSATTVSTSSTTTVAAPNSAWTNYVSKVGSQSATASARSDSATTAATAATTARISTSGVDLDEETSNLVIYQHAYQASARVISTINDVLDTLINMGAR